MRTKRTATRKPAGKLVKGANAASRSRLEAAANKSAEKAAAQEVKEVRGEKAKLRRRLAKPRAAVARFLKNDPAATAFRTELSSAVNRESSSHAASQSVDDIDARIAVIDRHRSLFERAYIGANVDSRALTAAVRSVIPARFERVMPLELGNVLVVPPLPGVFDFPAEFELVAPYGSRDTETSSVLVGLTDPTAGEDGFVRVRAAASADGVAYSAAIVGDVISVPEGAGRLKITASMRLSYEVIAWGVADVASAGCRLVLELTKPNGTVVRETDLVARVVAPLLWYAKKTGTGDFQITRTLSIPNNGGEFLVRAGVQETAWAGGAVGGAGADISGTVERIVVEAQS